MSKFYAGIGSRETPEHWLGIFTKLGKTLGEKGWTLRSGGAAGADQAFELGARWSGPKEIYLPWPNFCGQVGIVVPNMEKDFSVAEFYWKKRYKLGEVHVQWQSLKDSVKKLMTRNCYQILGNDLKTPVKQVLCWTKGGTGQGGTGMGISIAKDNNIPIFDFGKYVDYKESSPHLIKFIEKHGLKQ